MTGSHHVVLGLTVRQLCTHPERAVHAIDPSKR